MSENEQNDQPLEVMPPSAIMAMEKAQIDIQIATAHQYPRSLELFKKRALSMATLDPETAESCIYLRPVGKENGKMKYAEGPSIRLAEIVAVSYGNLRAASKVVEQTDRFVKCVGMAHDLESNTAMQADVIESTVTKDGHPYSERQRALTAKVCGAKALRDSIFKVVPRAMCKPIMEAAKKVAEGKDKPLEERRKKAQAWVATLKISEARVLAAVGVAGWSEVNDDQLLILTGLKTAMADGDETIDSAFPPVEGQPQERRPEQPKGPGNVVPLKPTTTSRGTAPATQTPSKGQTPAPAPAAAQPAPKSEPVAPKTGRVITPAPAPKAEPEPEGGFDAASADKSPGEAPAPETQETNVPHGTEGEPAPETPAAEPQQEAAAPEAPERAPDDMLPAIVPAEGEKVGAVKGLCVQSGVTEAQVLKVLYRKNIARTPQKLRDLATLKLEAIVRNWNTLLPEFQRESWE